MKIIIVSLMSLLVGLGIGCYIGYREWDRHITNEALKLLMESQESSEELAAVISMKAIGSIETDDTQKAIQCLSKPIRIYYNNYEYAGTNNELRTKLRAQIKELISTNKIVADEIVR
jgi:hypothetical protein